MTTACQPNREADNFRNVEIRAALAAIRKRYVDRNPLSLSAFREAASSMPGGNTRSVLHVAPFPLFFESGQASTLTDVDGHKYDDFLGEYTAGIYGHSHPGILAALESATRHGLSLGGHNRNEAQLAGLLTARFPALELVRFTSSGTEANLMALGAARTVTGRDRILVFDGAYHGGVLAFSNEKRTNVPFDIIIAPYNDIKATQTLIRNNASELAAVIVEPMLQSGGCIPAETKFLETLREETAMADIVLIFDEVVTSRLHPSGMHGALGLKPDLLTLGKFIGGGLNFGAFGGDRCIMEIFDPQASDHVPHAGTFNNNALTMSVAFAGMRDLFTPDAALSLNERGEKLRHVLNIAARDRQAEIQFTGIGSILSTHMTTRQIRSVGDAAAGNADLRDLLFFYLLENGIYIAKRGMISLSLTNSEAQIDRLVSCMNGFMDKYRSLLSVRSNN